VVVEYEREDGDVGEEEEEEEEDGDDDGDDNDEDKEEDKGNKRGADEDIDEGRRMEEERIQGISSDAKAAVMMEKKNNNETSTGNSRSNFTFVQIVGLNDLKPHFETGKSKKIICCGGQSNRVCSVTGTAITK